MNLTFEEAIKEYLDYVKIKKKNNTYITIERRIKKHIYPFFKSKKLKDISNKDYLNWQLFIEKKGFKYNYKSSLHYTFTDFYNFCYLFYNIENVAKKVGNFKNDDIEDNGNIWTIEEFNKFINIIDNPIYHALFNLSFSTLLRKKNYYCDLAKVKRIKIHEFRHSHACLLFMNDVPIDEISHRLGHSKISITTDTYLKYIPIKEKRVISTLNSLRLN